MSLQAQNRSEWAALAAGICAPVILWCTGASWLWVLCGGVLAIGVWFAIRCRMQLDRTLAERTVDVLGNGLGRFVLLLQAVSLAAAAAISLRRSGQIIPNLDQGYPWVPLVLIALALSAAVRGNAVVNRCAAVLFWLPVVSALLILLFALPETELRWLRPEGAPTQIFPSLAIFLLPVLFWYHQPISKQKAIYPVLFVLFGVLSALICAACLSPRLAATEKVAFFTMAATAHLLGLASRFDALLSAAAIVALFCFLAKLLAAVPVLTGQARKKEKMIAFCVLAFAGSMIRSDLLDVVATACATIFWGLIPLAILYIPKEKKF